MTHALIKNNEKKSHREEGEVVPGDYFVCPYGGGERGGWAKPLAYVNSEVS